MSALYISVMKERLNSLSKALQLGYGKDGTGAQCTNLVENCSDSDIPIWEISQVIENCDLNFSNDFTGSVLLIRCNERLQSVLGYSYLLWLLAMMEIFCLLVDFV